MAQYLVKPIPFKPPRLIGLSEGLLARHYEIVYGGAVRRLNKVEQSIASHDDACDGGLAIRGLKLDALAAANNVQLHEIYFDSLGGADGLGSAVVAPTGALADSLNRDFGTVQAWQAQFAAMAKSLMLGAGWVTLNWSLANQRLENFCLADDLHSPAGCVPILAIDMYDHAYQDDFAADTAAYVDAFIQNLHWDRAAARLAAVANLAVDPENSQSGVVRCEQLRDLLTGDQPPVLLDVCLIDDESRRYDVLPGARFERFEQMGEWIDSIPKDRPVVVYCMYGYQVSANAVEALRTKGVDAHQLAGGISAWRASGAPTEAFTPEVRKASGR